MPVWFVAQIDTGISALAVLQRSAAVTRRQTNGILCLIDDENEDEKEAARPGTAGRGRSTGSVIMSLV